MNLSEWRKAREPIVQTLPSGLDVKLKKVSVEALAMRGEVPLNFIQAVGKPNDKGEMIISEEDALKHIDKIGALMDAMVDNCVTHVRTDPETFAPCSEVGFVPSDELDLEDKGWVTNWASAGAQALEKFRPEQNANGSAPRDGEGLRDETISPSGAE